jgi:hypothetical protein
MFVRVFFVVRAVFNYNLFTDLYSKKLCKSYGFTANLRFAYKCLLKSDPGLTVLMTLLFSVFFLAYQLRIFEEPYYLAINQLDFGNFFSSAYCIVITMTTVGFGDIYPGTYPGRTIILLTAIWGAFLISLLILSVGEIFSLSLNERKSL